MVNKKTQLILLLLIFSVGLAGAVPTQVNPQTTTGLTISYPKFEEVPLNNPFNLSIHVYNLSSGLRLKTPTCSLEIYNHTGIHVIEKDLTLKGNEYNLFLTSGNFSQEGIYHYNIYCNVSKLGGFADGQFIISSSGETLTVPKSIIYSLIMAVLLAVLVICGVVYRGIPKENNRNAEMEIIVIEKYLRKPLAMLMYMIVLATVYLSSTISAAYVSLSALSSVFLVLFRIMGIGLIIFIPLNILLLIQDILRDRKLKRMQERGIFEE